MKSKVTRTKLQWPPPLLTGLRAAVVTVALLAAAIALFIPATSGAGSPPALAFTPSTNGVYDFGTLDVGVDGLADVHAHQLGGSATAVLTIALSGSTAFTKIARRL